MSALSAALSAAVPAAPLANAAAGASAGGKPPRAKRQKAPKIDIDETIALYATQLKEQIKVAAEARRMMRNEKRKKQRLVRKAGKLSVGDLVHIATLKRCGLTVPGAEDGGAIAADGTGAVVAPPEDAGVPLVSGLAETPVLAPAPDDLLEEPSPMEL